jgi:hypothetical protein
VIACGEVQVENDTPLNPVVIVEVLSKSTANYDRGVKFESYCRIPSFREYLICRPGLSLRRAPRTGECQWKGLDYARVHKPGGFRHPGSYQRAAASRRHVRQSFLFNRN